MWSRQKRFPWGDEVFSSGKTGGRLKRLNLSTLGPQTAILLSMALLPIGFLAVYQTHNATQQTARLVESTYVALTVDAAASQRELIERSFGVAEAIGATLPAMVTDGDRCAASLSKVVDQTGYVSNITFVDRGGKVACASGENQIAPVESSLWPQLSSTIEPRVQVVPASANGITASLIIAQPVFDTSGWLGYVLIKTPGSPPFSKNDPTHPLTPVDILAFSADGTLLTSPDSAASAYRFLPADVSLKDVAKNPRSATSLRSNGGETFHYVVIPVQTNSVFVLGIWPEIGASPALNAIPPWLFPLLMWLASMLVAYVALDRLVLRHVRSINTEIRDFGANRALPTQPSKSRMPREFEELQQQLVQMAQAVIDDEKALENALSQKSILLKEVHHRVKNNLQMISSIMNMQIRQAETPEMQGGLRRLQDRILGLALAHRTLHEIGDMGQINAARMIEDLAQQIRTGRSNADQLDIALELEDIGLYPEQTVPLALLFSEILANAIQFAAPDENGRTKIQVALRRVDGSDVLLSVENAIDEGGAKPEQKAGLGRRLINAFTNQLNGTLKISEGDQVYRIAIRFKPATAPLTQRDF